MKFEDSRTLLNYFIYTGEKGTEDIKFERNPLKLIPTKSTARTIPAKTNSFSAVAFHIVKLTEISPLSLPEVLRVEIGPLLKTRELQPFQQTVKRHLSCGLLEDIQTISRENEEKNFLHVLSMTGAPHVTTNHSLSMPSSLGLSSSVRFPPKQITSRAASFPNSEYMFPPQGQGAGTILVLIQSPGAKSLTRTVLTLSPTLLPSPFLKLLLEDSINSLLIITRQSLACGERNYKRLKPMLFLPIQRIRQPQLLPHVTVPPQELPSLVMFEPSPLSEILSLPGHKVERSTLQLSIVLAPFQLFPLPLRTPQQSLPPVVEFGPLPLPTGILSSPLRYKVQRTLTVPYPFSLPSREPSSKPPVVFKQLPLVKILPSDGQRIPRKASQLSIVTIQPQLSLLPLPEPPAPLNEILPHVNMSQCEVESHQLPDFNHSEKVEAHEDDIPKDNSAFETSMY